VVPCGWPGSETMTPTQRAAESCADRRARFRQPAIPGGVLLELRRRRDWESIRLVDMVIVAKSASGDLVRVKRAISLRRSQLNLVRSLEHPSDSSRALKRELRPTRLPTLRLRNLAGFSATRGPGRSPLSAQVLRRNPWWAPRGAGGHSRTTQSSSSAVLASAGLHGPRRLRSFPLHVPAFTGRTQA